MRHNQNRRSRGRNNRKGPNPLTRSYESNGPDVKVRGTAAHVADKYMTLARDAQSSGDTVAAENYLQHAEHYYRIVMAAQAQFQQSQPQFREGGRKSTNYDDDRHVNGRPRDRFDFNGADGRNDDEGDDRFDNNINGGAARGTTTAAIARRCSSRGVRTSRTTASAIRVPSSATIGPATTTATIATTAITAAAIARITVATIGGRNDRQDYRDNGNRQERFQRAEEPQPELPPQPRPSRPSRLRLRHRRRPLPRRAAAADVRRAWRPSRPPTARRPDGAAALAAFPD